MNTTTTTQPIALSPIRGLFCRTADAGKDLDGRSLVWGPSTGTCACGRGCTGNESITRKGVFGRADAGAVDAAQRGMTIEDYEAMWKGAQAPVAVAEPRTQPKTDGFRRNVTPEPTPEHPRSAEARAWLVANAASNEFALSVLSGWNKFGRPTERQMEAVLRNVDRDAARAAAPVAAPAARITKDGWYKVGDDIFKVQVAVNGSGNLYAKRLVVTGYGQAAWEYAPGVVRTLRDEQRLSVEDAAAFGALYGVCAVCGRTLTDEASIARGIGPVCIGRLG